MPRDPGRELQQNRIKTTGRKGDILTEMYTSFVRSDLFPSKYRQDVPRGRRHFTTEDRNLRAYAGFNIGMADLHWKFHDDDTLTKLRANIRKRIEKALLKVTKKLGEMIVDEYIRLVKHNKPYPAVASGDMITEDVGWEMTVTGSDPEHAARVNFKILVDYWIYQEYGFDMSKYSEKPWKLPDTVKRKIWEWGVAKGVVAEMLYEEGSEESVAGRERIGGQVFVTIQGSGGEEGELESGSLKDLSVPEKRVLNKLLYAIVRGNRSRDRNARYFFHTAYKNIMEDRGLVDETMNDVFREERVLTK